MNIIKKLPTYTLWALIAITVVFAAMFFFGDSNTVSFNNQEYSEPVYTGLVLTWSEIIAAIAIIVTLGFVIVHFVQNTMADPKSAIKPVAIIVGAVVLFLVAYALGDGTPLNLPGYDGSDNVESWLKVTDMFLFVSYTLVTVAIALILWSGISKYFK